MQILQLNAAMVIFGSEFEFVALDLHRGFNIGALGTVEINLSFTKMEVAVCKSNLRKAGDIHKFRVSKVLDFEVFKYEFSVGKSLALKDYLPVVKTSVKCTIGDCYVLLIAYFSSGVIGDVNHSSFIMAFTI